MNRIPALRILLLVALLLVACSPSPATEEPPSTGGLTLTDACGETIAFAVPPERVTIAGRENVLVVNAIPIFHPAIWVKKMSKAPAP